MLKSGLAFFLFLSACTSVPQTETSEEKLAEQAKIVGQAADNMVNETVSKFDISDTEANEGPAPTSNTAQTGKR